MMKQKLYAFWRYDLYPYFLGGPITKMNESGLVETENYGPGFFFKPLLIVPEEKGKEIVSKLKLLDRNRAKRLRKLIEEFDLAISVKIPELKEAMK